MSQSPNSRAPTNQTGQGAPIAGTTEGAWERLLFRPVGLWVVLLLVLLSIGAIVMFGAAVRHQYSGGAKLGRLGPVVEAIAGFPTTARQAIFGLRGDKYELAAAENRFDGAAGFLFKYAPGERPDLG